VDEKRVKVFGGKGGDGCMAFSRLFANEFAGPDGGDGGNGGHVLFQASLDVNSLSHLPTLIRGNDGSKGLSKLCEGRNADPVVFQVPFGTIFKNEAGEKMADLSSADECVFLAARGGAGGRGNKFFATPENQSPEVAEFGAEGESNTYLIEISTMAHIGLVGFPNAGKSTLLQAISRARPKIAPYPFTTLRPHVGMVMYDDLEQVAVADIPGLISDAHKNRGLGFAFLRHIQRCLCLVYVIDLASADPWAQLQTLYNELDHYDLSLRRRPSIVLGNKMDLKEARDNFEEFKAYIEDDVILIPISAKHGINLKELLSHIRMFYDQESAKLIKKYTESKSSQLEESSWKKV